MKKKLFLVLGIAALFLVMAGLFSSCDDDPSYRYEWVLTNRSRYTIKVEIDYSYNISPRSFTVSPGSSKRVGSNTYYYYPQMSWYRTDGGGKSGVYWSENDNTWYNSY